jgi:hypothetical protein
MANSARESIATAITAFKPRAFVGLALVGIFSTGIELPIPGVEYAFLNFISLPVEWIELGVNVRRLFFFCHGQDQIGWNPCSQVRMKFSEMYAGQFDQATLATRSDAGTAFAPQNQPSGAIDYLDTIDRHDAEFA